MVRYLSKKSEKDFSGNFQGQRDNRKDAMKKAKELEKEGYKNVRVIPYVSYGERKPNHYDIYSD